MIIKKYVEKINEYTMQLNDLKKQIELKENRIENLDNILNELEEAKKVLYKELTKSNNLVNNDIFKRIDEMNGLAFENFIVELLIRNNYSNVIKTKASGDFGIDIIAEKENIKYAFQCKNYQSPIGNNSVQEAYSGKQYYDCDIGCVITNSTFTPQAKKMADKLKILLWDKEVLINLINSSRFETNPFKNMDKNKKNLNDYEQEEYDDPLYNEVVNFVIQSGKISVSLMQRRFRLGYNRAARIMDLLEERGIIGSQQGSKPREVLVKYEY